MSDHVEHAQPCCGSLLYPSHEHTCTHFFGWVNGVRYEAGKPVVPPPQTADEMIALLRGSIARAHALAAKKPCARCAKFSAVARPAVCPQCREGA